MRVKYAGSNVFDQLKDQRPFIDKFAELNNLNIDDVVSTHFHMFFRIGGEIFASGIKIENESNLITQNINKDIQCTQNRNTSEKSLMNENPINIKEEGLPVKNNEDLTNMIFTECDVNICQMSASETRVLFLDDKGCIYKHESEDTPQATKLPILVNTKNTEDSFCKISCGRCLSVALTKNGRLFNLPNELNFNAADIVDIKTGREHCLLLDKFGSVYSFGRGSRGQLGHSSLEDEEEPRKIEAFNGLKIKKIAAGGWHSCAISEDGDLYAWGWNSNGQTGLKELNVMATPTPVDILSESGDFIDVSNVECGVKHTVLILADGRVCGFGWNKYGQLTCENAANLDENITSPKFFNVNTCKDIRCGPWSTFLLYD